MKNLKLLTIGGAILFLASIAIPAAVQAHCNGKHAVNPGKPDCWTHDHDSGGRGGRNDGNLEASFCLDIDPGAEASLTISSDGGLINGHDYCDDRDQRVSIFTGKGPGFNFETYTRKGGTWVRSVRFNCDSSIALQDDLGNTLNPFRCGESYAMTFRFDQDDGALDLGSLDPNNGQGTVSIFANLSAANGDGWLFAHGTVTAPATSGHLANNPCVAGTGVYSEFNQTTDLKVTRIKTDEWMFEHSGDVCLWDQNASLEFQAGTRVNMEYTFLLYQE